MLILSKYIKLLTNRIINCTSIEFFLKYISTKNNKVVFFFLFLFFFYIINIKLFDATGRFIIAYDLLNEHFVTSRSLLCTRTCIQHAFNILEAYGVILPKWIVLNTYLDQVQVPSNINDDLRSAILFDYINRVVPYICNTIQASMTSKGHTLIVNMVTANSMRFIGLALPNVHSVLLDSYIEALYSQLSNIFVTKEIYILLEILRSINLNTFLAIHSQEFEVYVEYLQITYLGSANIHLDVRSLYTFFIIVKWLAAINNLGLDSKHLILGEGNALTDAFLNQHSDFKNILINNGVELI